MEPRVQLSQPTHAFATAGAMLYVFWKTGVSMEATGSLFEIMDALLEERPSIGILVTVYEGIELPQRDAQTAISDGLKARTSKLEHGVATVIEGSGIGATLGRSIARTISLFSRQGYPSKVFPDPNEGLTWLRGLGADDGANLAVYRELRTRVDGSNR